MRYTLEQLKAMAPDQLSDLWFKSQFPFDHASCGECVTTHRLTGQEGWGQPRCVSPEHAGIRADSLRVGRYGELDELFASPEKIEQLYAIRLFYDHLYPQPAEAQTADDEQYIEHRAGLR